MFSKEQQPILSALYFTHNSNTGLEREVSAIIPIAQQKNGETTRLGAFLSLQEPAKASRKPSQAGPSPPLALGPACGGDLGSNTSCSGWVLLMFQGSVDKG